MNRTNRWMLALPIVSALTLVACTAKPPSVAKPDHAHVEKIDQNLKQVVLSAEAAKRLDVKTAPIRDEQVTHTRIMGGEIVADGARLAVRVPLSASDQDKVDRMQAGRVLPLMPNAMNTGIAAQPAAVADSGSALYYGLDNPTAGLAVGQRVRVEVPLNGSGAQHKVVPYASVIYDLKGEAWAYTSPAPLTFVRDRISIDYVDGDLAVLSQGPASGTPVVTTGAAELFGTEAGVGH
jgi:hypothetical protein